MTPARNRFFSLLAGTFDAPYGRPSHTVVTTSLVLASIAAAIGLYIESARIHSSLLKLGLAHCGAPRNDVPFSLPLVEWSALLMAVAGPTIAFVALCRSWKIHQNVAGAALFAWAALIASVPILLLFTFQLVNDYADGWQPWNCA